MRIIPIIDIFVNCSPSNSSTGTYFVCFIAQLLTFLILNNEICTGSVNDTVLMLTKDFDIGLNCSISTRGYCSVFASVFFLILGILIVVCPTPKVHLLKGLTCCGDKNAGMTKKSVLIGSRNFNCIVTTIHVSILFHVNTGCETSKKTETHNPDGSITIKEEKHNKDGTKSITIKTKHMRSAEV